MNLKNDISGSYININFVYSVLMDLWNDKPLAGFHPLRTSFLHNQTAAESEKQVMKGM